MKTVISTKGQIVLPAEIRRRDSIRLLRLRPRTRKGAVAWLMACPEKGWFVPIHTESTDSL